MRAYASGTIFGIACGAMTIGIVQAVKIYHTLGDYLMTAAVFFPFLVIGCMLLYASFQQLARSSDLYGRM